MKTAILKHLFLLLLFATASISIAEAQTHNNNPRRRQRHQTVENKQNTTDSTKHVGATIATPKASKSKVIDEQIIEESATAIDGATLRDSRQNTPQQLDSALALLKYPTSESHRDWKSLLNVLTLKYALNSLTILS